LVLTLKTTDLDLVHAVLELIPAVNKDDDVDDAE